MGENPGVYSHFNSVLQRHVLYNISNEYYRDHSGIFQYRDHKSYFSVNDSLITRARNNLIAITDMTITHIMFIDIKWFPYDIYKLILSDKDVIGGAYPIKKYTWKG
jgi:hypothetical protein